MKNNIRIVWSCSNEVKIHNVSYISLKILATGRPVAKALIKYNSNNLEENDEEEKEPINIELTDQKQVLIMMKMLLTLNDQMYKKKTKKILLWLTSVRTCKSKLMSKFFQKINWMIVISYLIKRKAKKIFIK